MPDHGKLFLDLREELRRGRKSSSQYEGPMPKNLRSRDPKWVMDKVLEDKWKAWLMGGAYKPPISRVGLGWRVDFYSRDFYSIPEDGMSCFIEEIPGDALLHSTVVSERDKAVDGICRESLMEGCRDILNELLSEEHAAYAWPFYQPVDVSMYKDYRYGEAVTNGL